MSSDLSPEAGPSLRSRWAAPVGAGIALLGLMVLGASISIWIGRSPAWAYDFHAYYDAALRLIATGTPYQAETLSGPFRPGVFGLYLYSPPLALLFEPLTVLGDQSAILFWLGLRLAVLALTCALMPVSRNVRLATFGFAAVTPPLLEDLNLGNVSLIVTFLAVIIWRSLDRPLAGVALALSILLRPTMAVVGLWWVLRRRLIPVVWAAATLVLIVLATLPLVGLRVWFEYATVLRNVSDVTGVYRNFDLASFVLRLGASADVAGAVLVATFVVAAAAVLLSLRRDPELSFVVTIGASLLLSPLLWNHYMLHLLIPTAFLAARGKLWGLGLPLLTWLPQDLLGFVALAGTLLPFTARNQGPVNEDASSDEVNRWGPVPQQRPPAPHRAAFGPDVG